MAQRFLKPGAGRLLISEPVLQDFYFRKSVVLLADHSTEGSFGVIINKPVDINLSDIVSGFPPFNSKVFLGGPVKTDSIFFIHTRNDLITDATRILDGIYWGGDIDQVQELMRNGGITEGEIRFFIGYSGWSPGQLDDEMENKSWIVSSLTRNQILTKHPETMWSDMLKSLGGEYVLWSNYPNDPALN